MATKIPTHTPWPWKAIAVSDPVPFKRQTRNHRMEIFAGPHKVARLGGTFDDYKNARLIAAAPELLAALKALLPEYIQIACVEDAEKCDGENHSDGCYAGKGGVAEQARVAIAKAEGR